MKLLNSIIKTNEIHLKPTSDDWRSLLKAFLQQILNPIKKYKKSECIENCTYTLNSVNWCTKHLEIVNISCGPEFFQAFVMLKTSDITHQRFFVFLFPSLQKKLKHSATMASALKVLILAVAFGLVLSCNNQKAGNLRP